MARLSGSEGSSYPSRLVSLGDILFAVEPNPLTAVSLDVFYLLVFHEVVEVGPLFPGVSAPLTAGKFACSVLRQVLRRIGRAYAVVIECLMIVVSCITCRWMLAHKIRGCEVDLIVFRRGGLRKGGM